MKPTTGTWSPITNYAEGISRGYFAELENLQQRMARQMIRAQHAREEEVLMAAITYDPNRKANANVGEWVEEVEVQRSVTETVKLYPGARVNDGVAEWVLLSENWGGRLRWATPKDGYLGLVRESGSDSRLVGDTVLSVGDSYGGYFLNHTVTKTVTTTETKRTPVGAGSVFERDGMRVVLVKMNPTPVRYFQGGWGLLYPTGGVDTGPDLTLSLDSQLKFLKSCGYRLIEAKGV